MFGIVLLLAVNLVALPDAAEAQSQNDAACFKGNITIKGSVKQAGYGFNFNRRGTLAFTRLEGSGNPIDFWIQTGAPFRRPERGALVFMTNSFLYRDYARVFSEAAFPMASVKLLDKSTVKATVLEGIEYNYGIQQVLMMNSMNYSTGLTSPTYLVIHGVVTLNVDSKNRVSGDILLAGRESNNLDDSFTNVYYQAKFTGSVTTVPARQARTCLADGG